MMILETNKLIPLENATAVVDWLKPYMEGYPTANGWEYGYFCQPSKLINNFNIVLERSHNRQFGPLLHIHIYTPMVSKMIDKTRREVGSSDKIATISLQNDTTKPDRVAWEQVFLSDEYVKFKRLIEQG